MLSCQDGVIQMYRLKFPTPTTTRKIKIKKFINGESMKDLAVGRLGVIPPFSDSQRSSLFPRTSASGAPYESGIYVIFLQKGTSVNTGTSVHV